MHTQGESMRILFVLLFLINSLIAQDKLACYQKCDAQFPPSPVIQPQLTISNSFVYDLQNKLSNYPVDVVFLDGEDASISKIKGLKDSGKKVICYFNAGSFEAWRSDAKLFPKEVKGLKMDGWDEYYLDIRSDIVKQLMEKRIELAKSKGCDGVDPDNVDSYLAKSGFPISKQDQINYLKFLSSNAKSKSLLIGLKNNPELVKDLVNDFNFVVAEECNKYKECDSYKPFIENNKPVFGIEYTAFSQSVCNKLKEMKFQLIFANLALTKFSYCK